VTGGLATGSLAYAADVGAEVIQVFVSNSRGWAAGPGDPAEDAGLRDSGIPVFIHATYLINLGSGDPDVAAKSAAAVAHALRRGGEIGARGVVIHTGSAAGWPARAQEPGAGHQDLRERALRQVASLLLPLLGELDDDDPDLLLEPMAGQGQMLCARASELAAYLDALGRHPKAGICLDTCHMFAAGHDLTAPGGVSAMLAEVAAAAGAGRVRLVHANDSVLGCGSRRDRHEAIGAGAIGTAVFGELLAHPSLADVPFVVETPGGKAGHARDIGVLKELRAASAADGADAADAAASAAASGTHAV
jgi:deoxyribonuclease-4